MDNDKELRLLRRAREVKESLNRFGRRCDDAEKILELGRTREGLDRLSELSERDRDYSIRYNHYVYHCTYPEGSEKDAVEYAEKSVENLLKIKNKE